MPTKIPDLRDTLREMEAANTCLMAMKKLLDACPEGARAIVFSGIMAMYMQDVLAKNAAKFTKRKGKH